MNLILAALVLALLSIAGAWYGYSRGRSFVMSGGFMAMTVLIVLALAGWSLGHLFLRPWTLSICATTVLLGSVANFLLRRRLKRHNRLNEHVWWRYIGVAMGISCAPCMGLLLGVLIQSMSPPAQASTNDHWTGMRSFGAELGALSSEILQPVPILGARAADVTALINILNTPRDTLAAFAQDHELATLIYRPAVHAALLDIKLGDDLAALADGDMVAIHRILQSPRMRAVLDDKEVRRIAKSLNLQDLATELAALEAERKPR